MNYYYYTVKYIQPVNFYCQEDKYFWNFVEDFSK